MSTANKERERASSSSLSAVDAVPLDLDGAAGAGEFVAHLAQESLERSVLRRDQPRAQLVTRLVAASAKQKKKKEKTLAQSLKQFRSLLFELRSSLSLFVPPSLSPSPFGPQSSAPPTVLCMQKTGNAAFGLLKKWKLNFEK